MLQKSFALRGTMGVIRRFAISTMQQQHVCVEQKTKNQRGEEEDHPLSNCHFAPLVLFYNTSNLKIHCHPPPPLSE